MLLVMKGVINKFPSGQTLVVTGHNDKRVL